MDATEISLMNTLDIFATDHKVSLSLTLKVILWKPVERSVVLNDALVLNRPSLLDIHSYPEIVPSSSEPLPLKDTLTPSSVDLGDMLVMVAFGYAFTTNQEDTFGDQVV
jgi:hypothetical protein